MIKIRNVKQAQRSALKWIHQAVEEAEEVARGLAVVGFKQIVEQSAQKSGNFAGNWQFSINSINYEFKDLNLLPEGATRDDWFIMGDSPAINYAYNNNRGRENGFKLGSTIHIANSATEVDDPYAVRIESGEVHFRPGNIGAPVASTVVHLGALYRFIGKASAQALKGEKI